MFNNKTKRVFWGFYSLDYKAIEFYLEEMARKGWMLEKIGYFTAKFKKMQPADLKFFIDVFADAGPITPENTNETREYRELCKESGWNFITSQDYLQFFYAEEKEDPVPLQTDDVLEQEIVEKTLWKGELRNLIILIVILSVPAVIVLSNPNSIYNLLFSNTSVLAMITLPVLLLTTVISTLYGLFRTLKAKRNIKLGLPIEKISVKRLRLHTKLYMTPIFMANTLIIAAIIADLTINPIDTFTKIFPSTLGVFIGLTFRAFMKRKAKEKKDAFKYGIILIIILFVSMRIFDGTFLDNKYGEHKIDTVPNNYTYISSKDLVQNHNLDITDREFKKLKSPVVYMGYKLKERTEYMHETNYIYTNYYETANLYFAEKIFSGIVKNLEDGFRWNGMRIFTKEIVEDENLKNILNADRLALTKEKDEIIIQKGTKIINISGAIDFYDTKIIELIMNKFLVEN